MTRGRSVLGLIVAVVLGLSACSSTPPSAQAGSVAALDACNAYLPESAATSDKKPTTLAEARDTVPRVEKANAAAAFARASDSTWGALADAYNVLASAWSQLLDLLSNPDATSEEQQRVLNLVPSVRAAEARVRAECARVLPVGTTSTGA